MALLAYKARDVTMQQQHLYAEVSQRENAASPETLTTPATIKLILTQ